MTTYDPILSGPLNLYNVTLAVLTAIGVGVVVFLIVRDLPGRMPLRGWVRRVFAGAGIALLAIGAITFVALILSPGTEDIAAWGVFYVLPAALLTSLAILGAIRPLHAGITLIAAAFLALIVVGALGGIADRIDPRWGVDQIDVGSSAAAFWFFALPATLTGLLLLVAGTPAVGPGTRETGSPHPV